MQKIKSFYPPACVQGPVSGRWYIVANGVWTEVDRKYQWSELERIWEKDSVAIKPIVKKSITKTYHNVGSNGEIYIISVDDGFWTCTCPAHGFGRGKDCKHILFAKNE